MTTTNQRRLSGLSTLVTGAARGVGKAVALAFASEGADVAALDIDSPGLERLAYEIEKQGARCVPLQADLESLEAIERAAEQAFEALGDIHVLVNNAQADLRRSLIETTDDELEHVLAVNVRAPLLLTKLVGGRMIDRGIRGRVINVTSTLAERPVAGMAAYVTSMGALRTMTGAIAQELAEHEIAVNAVGPGLIPTDATAERLGSPGEIERAAGSIPWGRVGEPEEVAAVCVFLASGDAEYVAGSSIYVDGGALLT